LKRAVLSTILVGVIVRALRYKVVSVTDNLKLEEVIALLKEIRAMIGVPPKIWLTPEEAADYLGISRSRLYQYVREGSMLGHYLPDSNMIRLNRDELDVWVRSGRRSSVELSENTIRKMMK
jgi:excisionase family DNA binding protein